MIVKDPAEVYHSIKAFSSSYMRLLKQCPAKLKAAWESPQTPTPEMVFGSLFHAMVLEPETIARDYHVLVNDGRTKAGKEERAKAELDKKICINAKDYKLANDMSDSLYKNPVWREITSVGNFYTEQSVYWRDDELNTNPQVECKARIDGFSLYGNNDVTIIDLKTCADSSPDAIAQSVSRYSLHLQCAWYTYALTREGYNVEKFIFFFIEKNPPYICTPAIISQSAYNNATAEISELIKKYSQLDFQIQNYIPDDAVITVDLLPWYK